MMCQDELNGLTCLHPMRRVGGVHVAKWVAHMGDVTFKFLGSAAARAAPDPAGDVMHSSCIPAAGDLPLPGPSPVGPFRQNPHPICSLTP
jgi:hypothetical protein